jgi:hypothetical protein
MIRSLVSKTKEKIVRRRDLPPKKTAPRGPAAQYIRAARFR